MASPWTEIGALLAGLLGGTAHGQGRVLARLVREVHWAQQRATRGVALALDAHRRVSAHHGHDERTPDAVRDDAD